MLPGGQVDFGLGLSGTKMQMIEVVWNRLIQRRHLRVDQEVMVPAILSVGACRRYPHAAKSKMNH